MRIIGAASMKDADMVVVDSELSDGDFGSTACVRKEQRA